jgi:hypothetical protein
MAKIKCPRLNCKNAAEVRPIFGVIPCKSCRTKDTQIKFEKPEFYNVTKQERIMEQRDKFEKDMLPPYIGKDNKPNPDFVREYPEMATDYFSEEQLTKL